MPRRQIFSTKNTIGLLVAVVAATVGWFSQKPPATPTPNTTKPPAQNAEVVHKGMGRVVRISDGDTLVVLLPKEGSPSETIEEKVRLLGINTPESNRKPGTSGPFTPEPFSLEAKEFLAATCPVGATFKIEFYGRDKFGRMLGIVFLPDGREVNEMLIEAGLAKVFMLTQKKYEPINQRYQAAEGRAQREKKGMWSGK